MASTILFKMLVGVYCKYGQYFPCFEASFTDSLSVYLKVLSLYRMTCELNNKEKCQVEL